MGIDSLLRFYNSKSISFASFLVGCIFGLFTALSLLRNTIKFSTSFSLLSVSYWTIFLFGGYCMLKYGYYAMLAEKTLQEISQMMKDPSYRPSLPREGFTEWLSGLFHPVRSGLLKVLFFGGIYLGIGFVAYFAIFILLS